MIDQHLRMAPAPLSARFRPGEQPHPYGHGRKAQWSSFRRLGLAQALRLSRLPAEIANGINTAAFVSRLTQEVRDQFLNSAVPEAGRFLKEQGDRLRQLVSDQAQTPTCFRRDLDESGKQASRSMNMVDTAMQCVKSSVTKWDQEMAQVQLLHQGLTLLTGILLGALMYWWVINPTKTSASPRAVETQQTAPVTPVPARTNRHAPK
jgi:hypothetical protein